MPRIIVAVSLCINIIFQCNGVSLRQQLEHIAKTRLESRGKLSNNIKPSRRFQFDPKQLSDILGVPNRPSHLPEAEPILPGHTLLKPTLGMLKSALKFPHKELEDGAGVYGSFDSLGIKYDGKNERVLYSGFRRFPADYIMVIPTKTGVNNNKPSIKVVSTVLELERESEARNRLLDVIKKNNNPAAKSSDRVYIGDLNRIFKYNQKTPKKIDKSRYLNNDVFSLFEEKSALRNSEKTNNSSSSERDMDVSDAETAKAKKNTWFYNSKDSYNHIKIDADAPELNELVPPPDDSDIRKWWFYSADDYKQFT